MVSGSATSPALYIPSSESCTCFGYYHVYADSYGNVCCCTADDFLSKADAYEASSCSDARNYWFSQSNSSSGSNLAFYYCHNYILGKGTFCSFYNDGRKVSYIAKPYSQSSFNPNC